MTKKIGMAWALSIAIYGCGGAAPEAAAPASAAPSTASSPGDQVAQGAKLYGDNCASCHGAGGEGSSKVPSVVGKNALPLDAQAPSQLRKAKFHTAADVFQFVKTSMPPNKGGSLTDAQYAAIMAFDLKANGVELGGKSVDATTAPTFVLHP